MSHLDFWPWDDRGASPLDILFEHQPQNWGDAVFAFVGRSANMADPQADLDARAENEDAAPDTPPARHAGGVFDALADAPSVELAARTPAPSTPAYLLTDVFEFREPEAAWSADAPVAATAEAAALARGGFSTTAAASRYATPPWADETPELASSALYSAADFTGEGQRIVVIDDGYSPYYDQSNTVFGYDFAGWFNDANASVTKLDSHGSWVAQTIVNTASDVEIIHFKVFGDDGGGASMRDIEEALDAVVAYGAQWNVAAVNLSLGFGNATAPTLTQLSDEFAALDAMGVLSIAAAGNSGATYPDGVNILAADPNVIGVSAVDANGAFAGFSQTSATLTDIAAFGVNVPVETVYGATGFVSGTSFAAPEISGVAARLQEASLEINGERLDDAAFLEIVQNSGSDVSGYEGAAIDGYKVADADAALEYFIANSSLYDDPFLT